jgi:hypothetical protein
MIEIAQVIFLQCESDLPKDAGMVHAIRVRYDVRKAACTVVLRYKRVQYVQAKLAESSR